MEFIQGGLRGRAVATSSEEERIHTTGTLQNPNEGNNAPNVPRYPETSTSGKIGSR